MELLPFALIAVFILGFGAISGRISTTIITPPILFVVFGYLMGTGGFGLIDMDREHNIIHLIAELTLVLILFSDASRIDLKRLRKEHDIPVRMLTIGLPLTMICGALVAVAIFPQFSIWEAMVLAIVLAPTDAALGQAVVSSDKVPVRIRQTLNVESGLNDGFALPILVFFVCLALSASGHHDNSNWLQLAVLQLTLGPLVGAVTGYVGGQLVIWGQRTQWMNEPFRQLYSIGMALFAFAGAELVGGNGFLSAFCAGLVLGNTARGICESLYEFAEAEGQLLTLLTFLFFGAVMLPEAIHHFQPTYLLYALLSLTLVRMIPVALSLIGLKLKGATLGFLGWFGPRGIASILYGLLILEEAGWQAREEIFNITIITVLISVFAHGITAWPCVKWYERRVIDEDSHEHQFVSDMPLRHN